jgi:hypothetical protein
MSELDYATLVDSVLVTLACLDCWQKMGELLPEVGSLMDPERWARDYFARTYYRDPPEFHHWLTARFLEFLKRKEQLSATIQRLPPANR